MIRPTPSAEGDGAGGRENPIPELAAGPARSGGRGVGEAAAGDAGREGSRVVTRNPSLRGLQICFYSCWVKVKQTPKVYILQFGPTLIMVSPGGLNTFLAP